MRFFAIGAAASAAILALPGGANAFTAQGQGMMQRWSASDRCAASAQLAFPDYTPESNAKRDAQMKQCLAGANLPPHDLPPPPKP